METNLGQQAKMAKTIVISILLGLAGGLAWADWEPVGGSGDFTAYADRSTIRRSASTVKMWDLADYKRKRKNADGSSYLSTKRQYEYDCQEVTSQGLYFARYTDNMGRGEVTNTSSDAERKPTPVVPGSVGMSLWHFACEK